VRNLRRWGVGRSGRKGARKAGLETVEKLRGVILRGKGKLSRKHQGRTVDRFSWGKVGEVMRRGTIREKEPRQVGYPVRRSATSTEGAFEATMEAFHHPIRLWMKGGCVNRDDAKKEGKVMPEGGNKLRSTVRGDCVRDAKTGNPGCT
jgi:hypothetical protein